MSKALQSENAPRHELFGGWRATTWCERMAQEYRRGLWVLIVVFYILGINGLWRPQPDSALYLSLARNIASGQGYVYQGEVHRMAYPGLPYLLAGLMRLSPSHFMALADALMTASGLLAIYLSYLLFLRVIRPGAAMVAAFILAANLQMFQFSMTLLTDIPFLLGTVMVFLGGAMSGILSTPAIGEGVEPKPNRRLSGWLLVIAGLAICAVMRPVFYLLAACTLLAAMWSVWHSGNRKRLLITVAIALLVLAIAPMLTALDPRRRVAAADIYELAFLGHVTNSISHPAVFLGNLWNLISLELPVSLLAYSSTVPGNLIMTAAILLSVFWILRRWPLAMLWILATLALQALTLPVPRYMVPLLPLLVLAWWEMAVRVTRSTQQHVGNALAIGMCVMILGTNIARSGRQLLIEQHGRPFLHVFYHGNYETEAEMAQMLREKTPADAVIIAPVPQRVLAYLSQRDVLGYGWAVPPQWRNRPVYVVWDQADHGRREDLRDHMGVQVLPRIGLTRTRFRGTNFWTLSPARWLTESPTSVPPTSQPAAQ